MSRIQIVVIALIALALFAGCLAKHNSDQADAQAEAAEEMAHAEDAAPLVDIPEAVDAPQRFGTRYVENDPGASLDAMDEDEYRAMHSAALAPLMEEPSQTGVYPDSMVEGVETEQASLRITTRVTRIEPVPDTPVPPRPGAIAESPVSPAAPDDFVPPPASVVTDHAPAPAAADGADVPPLPVLVQDSDESPATPAGPPPAPEFYDAPAARAPAPVRMPASPAPIRPMTFDVPPLPRAKPVESEPVEVVATSVESTSSPAPAPDVSFEVVEEASAQSDAPTPDRIGESGAPQAEAVTAMGSGSEIPVFLPLDIDPLPPLPGESADAQGVPTIVPSPARAEKEAPASALAETPGIAETEPLPSVRPPVDVTPPPAEDELDLVPIADGPETDEPEAPMMAEQASAPAPSYRDPTVSDEQRRLIRDRGFNPDAAPYLIRPGDRIEISIPYETGSQRSVPVRPDGRISYLYGVEVMAAGRTYEELRDLLKKELGAYYKNPRVTVIGTNFEGNSVFVMGPVGKPGSHVIQNNTRLLDVLSSAGVLSLLPQSESSDDVSGRFREIVDLTGAYIARKNSVLPVDFKALLIDRKMENNNIFLEPGDFIFIPSTFGTEKKIYIVGQVPNPQVYYYSGSITFMEAMLAAGGAATESYSASGSDSDKKGAMARKCYIVRGGNEEPILADWHSIQKGSASDIQLRSGDIIYVPERRLSYMSRVTRDVIGEIVTPLKSILDGHDTAKQYYQRTWHLPLEDQPK